MKTGIKDFRFTRLFKLFLIIVAISGIRNSYAQNFYIDFRAFESGVKIDSTVVTNLKRNEKITIAGNEQLLLMWPNSAKDMGATRNVCTVFPNPGNGQAKLTFQNPVSGIVNIGIYTVAGSVVSATNTLLGAGPQSFNLFFPSEGVYFVSVTGRNFTSSVKTAVLGVFSQHPEIKYTGLAVNNNFTENEKLKSGDVQKILNFSMGDRLLFSSFSGKNNTYSTDSPTAARTYEVEFFPCTDNENNNYPIVKINSQWWMAKNMSYLPQVNLPASESETVPQYYVYGYEGTSVTAAKATANYPVYGVLYNWPAAINAVQGYTNYNRGICPMGWHIPSDNEWGQLITYLGGESTAGSKLKETGTTHWTLTSNQVLNQYGFTALPAGFRNSGFFSNIKSDALFWSSGNGQNPSSKSINTNRSDILGLELGKSFGFSLRCIKDESLSLSTTIVTGISQTTSVCGGNILADGGFAITARGVCWSTSQNPTIAGSKTTDGTGLGAFVSNLTGLTAGTTYYVRAYATNSLGTFYGNQLTFTTLPLPNLAVVATTAVSGLTQTTAVSGGTITFDGGTSVVSRGVCWGTASNPTISGSKTTNGTGTGSFVSNITGLSASTTYYLRAYATNSAGTAYGNEISFTTLSNISTPLLSTNTATAITQTTAISGGTVTSDGGSAVTERGICWNIAPNPTILNNKTAGGQGLGSFTGNLTGLLAGTTYFVRAYATNSAGTSYGNEITFTTAVSATVPSVSTNQVSDITPMSAAGGGEVISDGGLSVTERGLCWKTTSGPTVSDAKLVLGSGTGMFMGFLTGLVQDTKYYVRAYAINANGVSYGNEVSFTTAKGNTTPTVNTNQITNIGQATATGGGEVTSDGGSAVTERGLCWKNSENPTTSDLKMIIGSGTGVFTGILTGLASGETYYVRAYAINNNGISYGNQVSFTTTIVLTIPTVSTANITSITQTTATSGGNISNDGGAPVTSRGVCWSTTQNPNVSNSKTVDGSGRGAFTSALTGLSELTTYYVRAYATNSVGTAYGSQISFTTTQTATVPTVSTNVVTGVNTTSATCGGNVSADGGSAISARGVCWSLSQNPTVADSKTTDGSGTGSFTSAVTGLASSTTYYIRAYATNLTGTAYGEMRTFTTSTQSCTLPQVTTLSPSGIGANTVTLGGNITDQGGGAVTQRGIVFGKNPNPTTADSVVVMGSGSGTYSQVCTNVSCNTSYYARAFATNCGGTVYGNDVTFTTSACTPNFYVTQPTLSNANPAKGQSTTLEFRVVNNGTKGTYNPTVGVFVSTDQTYSPDDYEAKKDIAPFTFSQNDILISGSYTIPSDMPPGVYYLMCVIDCKTFQGEYAESNENDNVKWVKITIKEF